MINQFSYDKIIDNIKFIGNISFPVSEFHLTRQLDFEPSKAKFIFVQILSFGSFNIHSQLLIAFYYFKVSWNGDHLFSSLNKKYNEFQNFCSNLSLSIFFLEFQDFECFLYNFSLFLCCELVYLFSCTHRRIFKY